MSVAVVMAGLAMLGALLILLSSAEHPGRAGLGTLILLCLAVVIINPVGVGDVVIRGIKALIG